jgi:hypothetical protein
MAQKLHVPQWGDLMSQKQSLRSLTFNSGPAVKGLGVNGLGVERRGRLSSVSVPDVTFLRSWLVYDSSIARNQARGKLNWNFLIGVLLAGGASAGFWAGVGAAISSLR